MFEGLFSYSNLILSHPCPITQSYQQIQYLHFPKEISKKSYLLPLFLLFFSQNAIFFAILLEIC